jgi:hypothetical protein
MSAVFSPDGRHRYRLDRDLGGDGATVLILGVNPSDAGAEKNDQTIRKDLGFCARYGWGWLIKGNLFALVSTDVTQLRKDPDPVGPDNNEHLATMLLEADIVLAAWGRAAKLPQNLRHRINEVVAMAESLGVELWCFGTCEDGQPRHTLMLSYETPLVKWEKPHG